MIFRLDIGANEHVTLHSAHVMMHFPAGTLAGGNVDDWGQVQPQVSWEISS